MISAQVFGSDEPQTLEHPVTVSVVDEIRGMLLLEPHKYDYSDADMYTGAILGALGSFGMLLLALYFCQQCCMASNLNDGHLRYDDPLRCFKCCGLFVICAIVGILCGIISADASRIIGSDDALSEYERTLYIDTKYTLKSVPSTETRIFTQNKLGTLKTLTPKIEYKNSDGPVDAQNKHGIYLSGRVARLTDSDEFMVIPDNIDLLPSTFDLSSSESQSFRVVFIDGATIHVLNSTSDIAQELMRVHNPYGAQLCIESQNVEEADDAVLRSDTSCDDSMVVSRYFAVVKAELKDKVDDTPIVVTGEIYMGALTTPGEARIWSTTNTLAAPRL